jgi:hypothetical protein
MNGTFVLGLKDTRRYFQFRAILDLKKDGEHFKISILIRQPGKIEGRD